MGLRRLRPAVYLAPVVAAVAAADARYEELVVLHVLRREERESGAALLPPTSLIAANKRDYLPVPCFLYTGGSTSPSHKPLCCDRGTESAPAIRYRSPWLHIYAAGAVSKCVAGSYGRRPTRLGATR